MLKKFVKLFSSAPQTWRALYTDESSHFEKPANKNKIAVKVINHSGDEVLKVYQVK